MAWCSTPPLTMFNYFKPNLMLVAYLFFRVKSSLASVAMSTLHLPQAADYGGSLVNVWGLGCLCRIQFNSIFGAKT